MTAARGGVTLARTQYLPQLNGVYQDSRATQNQVPGIWLPTSITPTVEGPIGPSSGQSYWGSQAAALFSWEPLDFGLRAAKVGQARSAEEKSQADLALTRLQVATAVGNYFLRAVANQQVTSAAQANVDRWQLFDKSIHVLVDNQLRPERTLLARMPNSREQRFELLPRPASRTRGAGYSRGAYGRRRGSEIQTGSRPPAGSCRRPVRCSKPPRRNILWRADQMAACGRFRQKRKCCSGPIILACSCRRRRLAAAARFRTTGRSSATGMGSAPARGNWMTGVTILFPDVFGVQSAERAKADLEGQRAVAKSTL